MVAVASRSHCAKIGIQNLDLNNSETITEAATVACAVIRSPEFLEALRGRSFREACHSETTITGENLYALLKGGMPDFSVVSRKPFRAEAVTRLQPPSMAIRKSRFSDWRSGNSRRGYMINTLVHEMTHLFPGPHDGFRFADAGHGAECSDESLVSYEAGRIAEAVWLAHPHLFER